MLKSYQIGSLAFLTALVACSGGDAQDGAADVGLGDQTEPLLNRYSGPARVADGLGEVTVPGVGGGLRTIRYEVIDGSAVSEGDIDLGAVEELANQNKGLIRTDRPWPSRTLVYALNSNLTATQKSRISSAMTTWTNATGITFKERTTQTAYAEFTKEAGVCSSAVGRTGQKQLIKLDATGCGTAAILHEIGHALGLEHEHTRSDRGDEVDYYEERVENGKEHNFDLNNTAAHKLVGADLDFNSIMMYDSYAFAATNNGATPCNKGDTGCKPTLTLKGNPSGTWTNTTTLSAGDIRSVLKLYPEFVNPIAQTDRGRAPIRMVSYNTINKDQFCKGYGYNSADTAESTDSRPAQTPHATWNTDLRKWELKTLDLPIGIYTKITCKI